ncbi:hypothetical protein [Mycolicibacterium sp.]|uniref:hypothetical protein n=1 Tax=Mycolicibacterium sp. TaxID=2320850 RepID=UPI0037CBBB7E
MPPAETTRGLDAGALAEVRVAQAWFWDGYYVRRGVDLQHRFGSEVSTVTDLDVLGYSFDPSLVHHKRIGEVKSGNTKNTPRPLDRALWMRGLLQLINAESGEITTAFKSSSTVRDMCRKLGITVQNLDDLNVREARLHISQYDDLGSQGTTIALVRRDVQRRVKDDPHLERGYWFLVSEVWFLEPFDGLKRTLGLIASLSTRWPADNHHDELTVARWFFAEAISVAMLNLAVIAGEANTMDTATFRQTAAARLASGDIPFHALRALSDHVDTFVGKILAQLNAPSDVRMSAIGGLMPLPPDYTEPLLELISRFAAEAHTTAQLPRQLDAILFERLVRRRELSAALRSRLQLTENTERLMRLLAAFLRGQFALPSVVDRVLTTPLAANDTNSSSTGGQPTLFEPADSSPPAERNSP